MTALSFEDLPALLSLREAALAVKMTVPTLRKAIKRGELDAFIPRGRDPLRAGPRLGYRIKREKLAEWYFGQS